MAGLSSLLVVFFLTGIVAGMGFPTFVAEHGCVSSIHYCKHVSIINRLRHFTSSSVGEQDVSAQDVSATRWRKTFRQQNVAERLSPAVKTFRHQRRFGNKKNNL